MSLSNSQDVFEASLKKAYYSKNYAITVLSDLQEASTDPNTLSALEQHIGQTQEHVNLLEEVFQSLDLESEEVKSEGLDTLVSECESLLEDGDDEFVNNLLVNETILKLEHLEVGVFMALSAQAALLNNPDVVNNLQRILSEDQNAANLAVAAANQLVN